jgi:hypothetical protein
MFVEEVDIATAAFHTHGMDVTKRSFLLTIDFTQRQWLREIDNKDQEPSATKLEGDEDAKEGQTGKENEPEFVQRGHNVGDAIKESQCLGEGKAVKS